MRKIITENRLTRIVVDLSVYLFFTVAYSTLFSLGMECVLSGYGQSVSSVWGEIFPRFYIFCNVFGLFSFAALVFVLIWNLKVCERFHYTKTVWILQSFIAFAASIPMLAVWEKVFDLLRAVF